MFRIIFPRNIINLHKIVQIDYGTARLLIGSPVNKQFQQAFSSKKDETTESPRMREFRKKLRERTPIASVIRNTEGINIPVKQEKVESERMKEFHEKLKLQPLPRVQPRERFVDLVLVETDPQNGELLTNTEKDPTKWGDWQNGGRVSDF